MSTATIPKSEMRRNDNIIVGLGEVPAVEINGVPGWGLPGGAVTYSEETALGWAIDMDRKLRAVSKSPAELTCSIRQYPIERMWG
jgi:hypothetical protein